MAGDAPSQGIMVNDVVHLALGAYYANDSATCTVLVQKAVDIIKAWFLANATAMLPNLYYGQISPKPTKQVKGHGGFIEKDCPVEKRVAKTKIRVQLPRARQIQSLLAAGDIQREHTLTEARSSLK